MSREREDMRAKIEREKAELEAKLKQKMAQNPGVAPGSVRVVRPRPTEGADVHPTPVALCAHNGMRCLSSAREQLVPPHTNIGVGPPGGLQ